ncbi:MAG: universal stress protein, partial [Aeromicrobium sp.]
GVTLLLDGQTVAHGPLRYAFEHASRHHDILNVIHVEAADGSHDEAIPQHDMQRLIDSWRATYPQVWVKSKVVPGEADLATVVTFEHTDLLVLGRPHEHHAVPSPHGSLARAVIEHARCPVAVVPPDHDV